MEDFSVQINFSNGPYQTINLPSHFSSNNWAVYLEDIHLDVAWDLTGIPIDSWMACGYRLPYFPIALDSPSRLFDVNGKPTTIIGNAMPTNVATPINPNGINVLHYENIENSTFPLTVIGSIQTINVSLLDITTNNPVAISGSIPTMTLKVNNSPQLHFWSGGICKLRFIKLDK